MSAPEALRDRQLHGKATTKLFSSQGFVRNLDIAHELEGHTGCINALNWSPDGRYLVSGSDDTKAIIWDSYRDFQQAVTIDTGHTRNIFSTKFVPGTSNRTLITAAGDRQIRIFDVEYGATSSTRVGDQNSTRRAVYRAHRDRVKRIAVEEDGHCFLSCSEDGDIRQFDLREDYHTSAEFRAPLISYSRYQIDLNTISLNKINPYLLATGGSHPCAFLHDRRMVGRDLRAEWGHVPTTGTPTQCVKRFRPGNGRHSAIRGSHITALHFGNVDPRELICSWSCNDVYLFDIHGDVEQVLGKSRRNQSTPRGDSHKGAQKRKRSQSPTPVSPLCVSDFEGLDTAELFAKTRTYMLKPHLPRANYKSSFDHFILNFREMFFASEGELESHPLSVAYMTACTHLLGVWSHSAYMAPALEYDKRISWACQAIEAIAHSFNHFRKAEDARSPIMTYPTHLEEKPIRDIVTGADLFRSPTALVNSFNTIISTPAIIKQTHNQTGKKFWLEKVCRSLLASLPDLEDPYVPHRPEEQDETDTYTSSEGSTEFIFTDPFPEEDEDEEETGSEDEDDSEDDEDDDDDDDDDDNDDAFYISGEQMEDELLAREAEESMQGLEHAVQYVEPGVPIGLPLRKFSGHVNVETVKDVNFFGFEDEYVMSGSDDGLLFIWDKKTARIVKMLHGDGSVVNVMEGHPTTNTLAVSGIDDTVKIFQPFEGSEVSENTRRVTESEYQIRARNETRSRGEELGSGDSIRISRRMLMDLASQVDGDGQGDCRMQ